MKAFPHEIRKKNHYWKLGRAKIYLLKLYRSKDNFLVFLVWIIRSRQICWGEITMATIRHFLQLI